jgi:hypothetical protein
MKANDLQKQGFHFPKALPHIPATWTGFLPLARNFLFHNKTGQENTASARCEQNNAGLVKVAFWSELVKLC